MTRSIGMTGIELIAAERQRQIDQEGWTPEHDDEHADGSLSAAAACYALPKPIMARRTVTRDESGGRGDCPVWRPVTFCVPKLWPSSWAPEYWNPKDRVRDLVRAGALIAAEIDRLQRAEMVPSKATMSMTVINPAEPWPFPVVKP